MGKICVYFWYVIGPGAAETRFAVDFEPYNVLKARRSRWLRANVQLIGDCRDAFSVPKYADVGYHDGLEEREAASRMIPDHSVLRIF